MSKKVLLSGNEAIARGLYEYGCHVAAAYPGTPSTEISENLAQYKEINSRWSVNEKVAFEVAAGASIGGARSFCAMKHVGLNVAADPLMTFAYTGVNGGFIVVSADDPSMHSSQNEQDNRRFAQFAKIPVLNPSDPAEAKECVKLGFEISEEFDTPVLLRITTRIAHSKGLVEINDRQEVPVKKYVKDIKKYLMVPGNARPRHYYVEERTEKLKTYSYDSGINTIEYNKKDIGIITSGIAYQYAKEVFPEASFLKILMDYPFPEKLALDFAKEVKEVYVIEELEPVLEEQCKILGIKVTGKNKLPICMEFDQKVLREAFGMQQETLKHDFDVPVRPPVLCPGCPHRPIFHILRRLKAVVTGDIGCYTLGALPPLNAMDTCICMGASITNNIGVELAHGEEISKKSVAVIGDSTFFHSGLTGLVEAIYNKTKTKVLVVDNSITAMTGLQEHPGTAKTLCGEPSPDISIAEISKAIGFKKVVELDPYDYHENMQKIKDVLDSDEPAVMIAKSRCALLDKKRDITPLKVDEEKCIKCRVCVKTGCPALFVNDRDFTEIDATLCIGEVCQLCKNVCKPGAIFIPEK